jgi:hypothetical protein
MRLTEWLAVTVAGVACASLIAHAQTSPELLDLAGRVHYGYYQADLRALEAAQAKLDSLGDASEVLYYRDFAALRRAQLGARDRDVLPRVSDCAAREPAKTLAGRRAAEAWVLVAACALVAGDERRVDFALARARSTDHDHPRIALVEAWRLAQSSAPDYAALATQLTATIAAFDAWPASIDDPDWGQAEALTALAESTLERGEVRAARDLLERALLLAPDYRRAVELRTALRGARGESRAL